MDHQTSNLDYLVAIHEAKRLRAEAVGQLWRTLIDMLSPRLPKVFPAEF